MRYTNSYYITLHYLFGRPAGGLLPCSAARSSVCRVVLHIPRARHARLVADVLPTRHDHLGMSRWSESR